MKKNTFYTRLLIPPTETTPKVEFNHETKIFSISGESRPEDVRKFYGNLIEWFQQYFSEAAIIFSPSSEQLKQATGFSLEFKMTYFNSSSSKYFLDIINLLSEYYAKKFYINVMWFYEKGDVDMREAGEEFAQMVSIPIVMRENFDMLEIPPTSHTPHVLFNPEINVYEISGKSCPGEVFFYYQVWNWIDQFGKKYFYENAILSFNLTYFNSPTAKAIEQIIRKLNDHFLAGAKVKINWRYDIEAEEEIEEAEMFASLAKFPFEIIPEKR